MALSGIEQIEWQPRRVEVYVRNIKTGVKSHAHQFDLTLPDEMVECSDLGPIDPVADEPVISEPDAPAPLAGSPVG